MVTPFCPACPHPVIERFLVEDRTAICLNSDLSLPAVTPSTPFSVSSSAATSLPTLGRLRSAEVKGNCHGIWSQIVVITNAAGEAHWSTFGTARTVHSGE